MAFPLPPFRAAVSLGDLLLPAPIAVRWRTLTRSLLVACAWLAASPAVAQTSGSVTAPGLDVAENPNLSVLPATPERAAAARAELLKAVPAVQVWTNGRNRPRTPRLVGERALAPIILDEADQALLVRLAFDRSLAGTLCHVRLAEGWTLEASAGDEDGATLEGSFALRVRQNGRVSFVLRRSPEARRGDLLLLVNRVPTKLRFIVLSAAKQARLRESSPGAAADLD